jgi:hypothetical protein
MYSFGLSPILGQSLLKLTHVLIIIHYFISEVKAVLCALYSQNSIVLHYKHILSTANLYLSPKLHDVLDVPGKGILDFSVRQ